MSLTPHEFYMRYRVLPVTLVTGVTVEVDVHEYRNAADYFAEAEQDDIPEDHDVTAGMTVAWAALSRQVRRHGLRIGAGRSGRYRVTVPAAGVAVEGASPTTFEVNTRDLLACYCGKGSPEAIATALTLAHGLGLVGGSRDALQRYCDAYVGLDCSGFVGNYLRYRGSARYGPSTSSRGFAPPAARVGRIEDVRPCDTLCWDGHGHVALVDRVEPVKLDAQGAARRFVWVCEACGTGTVAGDAHSDGLNYTQYVLHRVGRDKKFTVARAGGWELSGGGFNAARGTRANMDVYIGRLVDAAS